ncbi:Kelch repeat-containing protein [Pedomonas sp. V897]|uniref:Kelch repeat-containing protein n=1 Tax=Pedomonas sp. V897 TaxID=3446482 RepID=UPI003EDF43D1
MLTRRTVLAAALGASAGLALRAAHAAPAGKGPAGAGAPRGTWTPCAPIPWEVQEVYATVRGGRIVIAGGLVGRGPSLEAIDRMGEYDPATDRWREGPRLPERRHHPALASIGARVYAIGGALSDERGNWQSRPEVFVEEGGVWSRAASLPEPQMESVALVHEGRIHLISGRSPTVEGAVRWDQQRDVDTHLVFDPAANRWSSARPIPGVRNSAAGAVIDGALYVVGGRTMEGGNMARLDRYDPREDRWDALRPMPRAAGGLAAAVVDGSLIAFGGEVLGMKGAAGVIADVWRYDVTRDVWEPLAPMRTPRHGLAGAVVGNRVYAIGGGSHVGGANTTNVLEALSLG